MDRRRVRVPHLLAAALAALGLRGPAAAQTASFDLDVSATVVSTCQVTSSGPYVLTFVLDPASQQDATAATSAISFWCTDGVAFSVTDGADGSHVMTGSTADTIPYALTYTPSRPTGGGPLQPITLTVDGTVAYTAFSGKKAGFYTDTVTVTINP